MNRFDQPFHGFDDSLKNAIPANYNFIYKFDKRGIVKKKGDAFFGVKVDILHTKQFYAWGHNKSISKIMDFTNIKFKSLKENPGNEQL